MARDPDKARRYFKQYHADNRERINERRREWRERMRAIMWNHKAVHPCIDCGETDPVVLDFDHRDPTQKSHSISRMAMAHCSEDRLINEMKKCDVRCSNCHRRRTHKQRTENVKWRS
jgi:DNA-directed RNA polymerase subunit RPC12/RpoP